MSFYPIGTRKNHQTLTDPVGESSGIYAAILTPDRDLGVDFGDNNDSYDPGDFQDTTDGFDIDNILDAVHKVARRAPDIARDVRTIVGNVTTIKRPASVFDKIDAMPTSQKYMLAAVLIVGAVLAYKALK